LLAGVLFIIACADLPSASDDPVFVTLTPYAPPYILVGEVDTLVVEAHDQAGNQLDDPPLSWQQIAEQSTGAVEAVQPGSPARGRRELRGLRVGTVTYQVTLDSEGGLFLANPATVQALVRYGRVQVAFEGVGRDTVITLRDELFNIPVSATDHNGLPVVGGEFDIEIRPGSALVNNALPRTPTLWTVWVDRDARGTDTLFLSHTACAEPCADTLVVTVAPAPVGIGFPIYSQDRRALWDTVSLSAHLVDEKGFPVEGSEPVWRHVVPGDSSVLRILEPVGGRVVSVANGSALLEVEIDGLTERARIEVDQAFHPYWELPGGLEYLVLGSRDTLYTEATDYLGHPLEAGATPDHEWSTEYYTGARALFLVETDAHWSAVVEAVDLGPGNARFWAEACFDADPVIWCQHARGVRNYTVIQEPDSVRILLPLMDPMTALGRSGDPLQGRIFTATERTPATNLRWAALDPLIATVDAAGYVTAVANGTARFEGRMGLAADTVMISVDTPGG
jgi:hypothetical protein